MSSEPLVAGLYAITDTGCIEPVQLVDAVKLAISGGARLIQYRDKSDDRASRKHQAAALAQVCQRHRTPFIVNDDIELAAHVNADGVHVGHEDPGLAEARGMLGTRRLIGVSCYNQLDLALAAEAGGADYVAFGSFYRSPTKPSAVRAGPELLRAAKQRLRIPIVAIGGITPENAGELIVAGADAVAVIHGVFQQADIRQAASRYAALFSPAPKRLTP